MRGMRGVSLNFSLNAGMFVAMEKYLFKYKNQSLVVADFLENFVFLIKG